MSITVDANSNTFSETVGATLTTSHTCTGNNLSLFVGVVSNSGDYCTGVTYNSVAMTLVDKQATTTSGYIYSFLLVAPATGANNIVSSFSTTGGFAMMGGVSYKGTLQSGQPNAHTTNTAASGTSYPSALTSTTDYCWHISIVRSFGGGTVAAGASTTRRFSNGSHPEISIFDTNTQVTPPGSNTLTITGTSGEWRSNDIMLSPIFVIGASTGVFTLTGFSSTLAKAKVLVAVVGTFILTGISATITNVKNMWTNSSKNSTTWTDSSKNS